jgi:hypothetical protein
MRNLILITVSIIILVGALIFTSQILTPPDSFCSGSHCEASEIIDRINGEYQNYYVIKHCLPNGNHFKDSRIAPLNISNDNLIALNVQEVKNKNRFTLIIDTSKNKIYSGKHYKGAPIKGLVTTEPSYVTSLLNEANKILHTTIGTYTESNPESFPVTNDCVD